MNSPERHQEIIIIKRGGEGEHGHHGGAWKIAFADFMTAMMALFLVLWLINAANEEKKKAVASYFNPVKLVDRNRSVKGLHDAEGVQDTEIKVPNEQFPDVEPVSDPSEAEAITEAQYFADPFSSLDDIAARQAPGEVINLEEEGGRNGNDAINDAAGGEAFMDPFSPNFWNEEVRPSNNSGQLTGRYETEGFGNEPEADKFLNEAAGEGPGEGGTAMAGDKTGTGDVASDGASEMETAAIQGNGETAVDQPDQKSEAQEIAALKEKAAEEAKQAEMVAAAAEDMRQKIAEQMNEAFDGNSELVGELSVTPSGGEILISLTDAFDMSMFEIGSAVPSPDLVIALEKIGKVLAEQAGGVRIHGHTDARPFKSGEDDNWRLSSARARSAYYMLLRGGLDETRVNEISGFADRQLLDPENPDSHKNRRIEVLVEVPTA